MKVPTLLSKLLGKIEQVDASQVENFNTLAAEFVAYKDEAEGVVQAYTTQVNELTTALADAAEQVASLTTALAEATAEKTAAVEAAAAQKLADRKEKIVALVGEINADAMLQVTTDMDDQRFETFIAAISGVQAKEAKSPLFKEVGATTDVEVPQTTESAEMKLLKAKYPQDGAVR